MTSPGSTLQHAELGPESSPVKDQPATAQAAGTRKGTVDYRKAAEKLAAADYQARMEHFHRMKASKPVVSFGGRPHGGPLNDRAG